MHAYNLKLHEMPSQGCPPCEPHTSFTVEHCCCQRLVKQTKNKNMSTDMADTTLETKFAFAVPNKVKKMESPSDPRIASLKNGDVNGGPFDDSAAVKTQFNRSSSLYSRSMELLNIRKQGFLFGPLPDNQLGPRALLSGVQCTKDVNNMGMIDPSMQCLEWKSKPQNVLVIKKLYDSDVTSQFKTLVKWMMDEKEMCVLVEEKVLKEDDLLFDDDFAQQYLPHLLPLVDEDVKQRAVDLVVCMGGDGTLLHVSSLFQGCSPPVIAFHLGSMGFLAPFSMNNFQNDIDAVLAADVGLQLRSRLKCQVREVAPAGSEKICCEYLVMNEVVIDRGSSSTVTNVEIYCNGRFLTTLLGDGLIISTPTGSTAYSAAAGASMVHPSVPGIVLTPICPHSLSFRPIVLPAGVELKIVVSSEGRNSTPNCSFDGRYPHTMTKTKYLRVTTSVYPIPCISHQDHLVDWFDSLAECLHWNRRETKRSHGLLKQE